MKSLALVVVAAAALAGSFSVPVAADGAGGFRFGGSLGGGIVDLATGAFVDPEPDDPEAMRADGAVTVLPFRAGARYRIPLILGIPSDADPVVVTDVRLVTAGSRVARSAGAVVSTGCCVFDRTRPLDSVTLAARGPGASSSALVGIDVELCCAPPPGWHERLVGVVVTYRQNGLLRMAHVGFPTTQTVVVRA